MFFMSPNMKYFMPCHKKRNRPNETTTNFGYVIYVVYHVIYIRERERQRETERGREGERERETDRQTETERETDREREILLGDLLDIFGNISWFVGPGECPTDVASRVPYVSSDREVTSSLVILQRLQHDRHH
jgi:hypothetical protein